MEQENVEVVRRAFDILKEGARNGDPGAAFDRSLGEALIVSTLVLTGGKEGCRGAAGAGAFVGRPGYVEFMRTFAEGFEGYEIEVDQIIDAGNDRVVVTTRHQAAGNRGRLSVETRAGAVITLVGRHIVGVDLFGGPNEALEAAGLSE